MVSKQQQLNIHLCPCDKIKQRFTLISTSHSNSICHAIEQKEFCAVLASTKLLQADSPKQDARWVNFYSKFEVMERLDADSPWQRRYKMAECQIALIFLAQGHASTKARAICELYAPDQWISPSPAGINKENLKLQLISDGSQADTLSNIQLSTEQLKCIVSIFVNLSLILLPLFATEDCPPDARANYNGILMMWTRRTPAVINHYLSLFNVDNGPIDMLFFIDKCQKLDIFNVLKIRDFANKTAVLQNANPRINGESLIDRDLFEGRISQDEINEGPPQDLSFVRGEIADAVLYKVDLSANKGKLTLVQKESRSD